MKSQTRVRYWPLGRIIGLSSGWWTNQRFQARYAKWQGIGRRRYCIRREDQFRLSFLCDWTNSNK